MLLVDVTFSNTSDQEQRTPPIGLWSEDIKGANDVLDNGVGDGSGYILEELYGEPSDRGLVQNHLPDDWNVLAAGETRTLTLPFLLPRGLLEDPNAFDDLDPARFCLALSDYDPPTVYRLWLG